MTTEQENRQRYKERGRKFFQEMPTEFDPLDSSSFIYGFIEGCQSMQAEIDGLLGKIKQLEAELESANIEILELRNMTTNGEW